MVGENLDKVQRFGFGRLLWVTTTFGIVMWPATFSYQVAMTGIFLVSAFWFGYAQVLIANQMDTRPINNRRLGPQMLAAFGGLLMVVSLIGGLYWRIEALVLVLGSVPAA